MADIKQASDAAPQTMVMLTPAQAAARELQAEMERNKAAGVTFGGEVRPGGYFIGEDGAPHDAHGNPIHSEADAERAEAQSRAEADANARAIAAMHARESGASSDANAPAPSPDAKKGKR